MTSRYIYDDTERLLDWAADRIPGHIEFRDEAQAIGHERRGAIVGVVAYDNFTDHSCMFHFASDGTRRWVSREFVIRALAYPFIQCGFRRMNALISVNNQASLQITRHWGWVPEGRLRGEGPDGEDMIVFGLLKAECDWFMRTGKNLRRLL